MYRDGTPQMLSAAFQLLCKSKSNWFEDELALVSSAIVMRWTAHL